MHSQSQKSLARVRSKSPGDLSVSMELSDTTMNSTKIIEVNYP